MIINCVTIIIIIILIRLIISKTKNIKKILTFKCLIIKNIFNYFQNIFLLKSISYY